MEKTCTKCLKALPVSEFHRNRNSLDGFQHYCKHCRTEDNIASGRKSGRRGVLWALNGAGKTKCAKCDEVFLLSEMPRNSSRKTGRAASCFSCQREYRQKYYAEHREEFREYSSRRRAAVRGATIEGTSRELKDWCRIILNDPCAYCGEPSASIDHVAPIDNGGVHGASNLVGACERCNRSKSTESLLFFLLRH